MLELQRASAGSGKTYTLAKKYLWYYLTILPSDEERDKGVTQRRLRTWPELADSARHILAVTFTNKATNEMQMRIVGSLFSLGHDRPVYAKGADGTPVIKSPDYMQEFCNLLKASPGDVARTARMGLTLLLENYSDFKVSTIDSFFQLVLRTFAYESELNDGYQVELDNDYLSQVSVDGTLEEVDNPSPVYQGGDVRYWVEVLMERGSDWNIFGKRFDSEGTNNYKEFISSVSRLENEEYKKVREDVERYFKSRPDLRKLYEDLNKRYLVPLERAYDSLRSSAREFMEAIPPGWQQQKKGNNGKLKNLVSQLKLIAATKRMPQEGPGKFKPSNFAPEVYANAKEAKEIDAAPGVRNVFETVLKAVQVEFDEWRRLWEDEASANWRLYAANLPYFALMECVASKRKEFLDESGAIELGETSTILSKIIGESDTPFVYERMGAVLDHFLIDEFQDTSELQWRNMGPLVEESMSRGKENLIIGDAKQSIYRFRNADPSLITSKVPQQFGDRVIQRGDVREENTNWRSQLRVVQFNNSLFQFIAGELGMSSLYSNVIQYPKNKAPKGYVEINLSDSVSASDWAKTMRGKTAALVDSLCRRGYAQKDIAVLVMRNKEGSRILEEFNDWNGAHAQDPEATKIRFVSEQSLKVDSAPSVQLITGVLRSMAKGLNARLREGEEARRRGIGNWEEIKTDFKFFSLNSDSSSMSVILEEFIQLKPGSEEVVKMLETLPSLALPALVEAIAACFLGGKMEWLRHQDAIYLAAFQDLVLEYCESHPTDLASFLDWWDRKSRTASISSPEGTDAVQIMTVHKSKGLEFKCVIVPFADWNFNDPEKQVKTEWRWVKPNLVEHESIPMPVCLPVNTSRAMELTSHSALLHDYFQATRMDALNSAYVAYTRAESELYIFSKPLSKEAARNGAYGNMAQFLETFCSARSNQPSDPTDAEHLDPQAISSLTTADGLKVIRIGEPSIPEPGKDEMKDKVLLEDYNASVLPSSRMRYRLGNLPDVSEIEDDDFEEEELIDPRSEGILKHAVLQFVRVASDLPSAVNRVRREGVLPMHMAERIENDLTLALSNPMAARWFEPGTRIINERALLEGGKGTKRPDRIVVWPDGRAEVVDYKFGRKEMDAKYRRQLGSYVAKLRKTGKFRSVSGYIWYVNLDHITLI